MRKNWKLINKVISGLMALLLSSFALGSLFIGVFTKTDNAGVLEILSSGLLIFIVISLLAFLISAFYVNLFAILDWIVNKMGYESNE